MMTVGLYRFAKRGLAEHPPFSFVQIKLRATIFNHYGKGPNEISLTPGRTYMSSTVMYFRKTQTYSPFLATTSLPTSTEDARSP